MAVRAKNKKRESALTAFPSVLLVDDRHENLVALSAILKSCDLNLVQASSGNEALAKTLEQDFCCILLDIEMPDLNGLEVAEILRNDPVLRFIPIILLTAHRKEDLDIFRGYEFGAVDYLVKPVQPAVVRGKVRVFADLYRKQRMISELNRELTAANEDLRQFAKIAAHDLKEPARLITTYCQLLAQDLGRELPLTAKGSLDILTRNAAQLRSMLDDLVALLSVRAVTERELIDLTKLVNEVMAEKTAWKSLAGVEILVGKLPYVHAQRAELKVVMAILLANAIKRSNAQKVQVRVSGQSFGGQTIITVRDDNNSIAENHADRVFELFQRLEPDSHAKTGEPSLAMCRAIIEKHGGRMWVESKEGEGSAFCFSLPRRESTASAPTAEQTLASSLL